MMIFGVNRACFRTLYFLMRKALNPAKSKVSTLNSKEKRKLLKLCEENNNKSPDILTAVVMTSDRLEAVEIAEFYFDLTHEKFTFKSYDSWARSLTLPSELYFVFKRKKDLGRFVRTVCKERPQAEVVY